MAILIAWSIAGFFLVLLSPLIIVFGGAALGVLIILGVLIAVPAVMISALVGRWPGHVESQESAAAGSSEREDADVLTMTVQMPVVAKVVEAQGVCPFGRAYRPGETWNLNGKWSGDGELCPRVESLLSQAATQVRSDEAPDGELRQCLGMGHRVVFQLRKSDKKETAAPVAIRR